MDNQITHFSHLFENITEVVKTKPYEKETRNNQKVEETEKEILNCKIVCVYAYIEFAKQRRSGIIY